MQQLTNDFYDTKIIIDIKVFVQTTDTDSTDTEGRI